jgi:hypothetical protein
MFTAFEPRQLSDLSVADKRNLVKQLREAIKSDIALRKSQKVLSKVAKDNAKKEKIQNAIKAAQDKLAKLQARLAA